MRTCTEAHASKSESNSKQLSIASVREMDVSDGNLGLHHTLLRSPFPGSLHNSQYLELLRSSTSNQMPLALAGATVIAILSLSTPQASANSRKRMTKSNLFPNIQQSQCLSTNANFRLGRSLAGFRACKACTDILPVLHGFMQHM